MNYNRGLPRGEEESPPWHVHPGYYSPSRVAIPGVLSVSLREKHEARLERRITMRERKTVETETRLYIEGCWEFEGAEPENKEEEHSSVVPCDFILAAAWPQHI